MKIIQYHLKIIDENGEAVQGLACSMTYSEANLRIAEAEAFGAVSVEEDGTPEPEAPVSTEARIAAMEAKFAALEAAYTEGVTEA